MAVNAASLVPSVATVAIATTRIEAWNKDDSGLDPELFGELDE